MRDGRYVVRGHVVEVRDGKQVAHATSQDTQLRQQQGGVELQSWRSEMLPKYEFPSRQNEYFNGVTNGGILYAMNNLGNEGKLYSSQPGFDPYCPPGNRVGLEAGGKMGGLTENDSVSDTLTVEEQERLRADAISKGGPKLAFIKDESQKEPPEGALPCIMGRDSPGGSITSLDSLDEVPNKGQESGSISRAGIISKGSKDASKFAGKRRVTFSDSIEFDDGVTGQLVTEEKQSTKVYTMLYARNVNNYYNMPPSTSSTSTSVKSLASQKGTKNAAMTSVEQTLTEQNNTSAAFSAVKAVDREPSVVTVVHSDQPKAKPVALVSHRPTKPETTQFSLRQENVAKGIASGQETYSKDTDKPVDEANFVSGQSLNDSLEIIRDSLDEKDSSSVARQEDEECSNESAVTWTIGTSSLKDSLERYVKSTAESTAEELIDEASCNGGRGNERDNGFAPNPSEENNRSLSPHLTSDTDRVAVVGSREETAKGFVSTPLEGKGSGHLNSGYVAYPSPVLSSYQHYRPVNSSPAPAVFTSPYAYQQNANAFSGVQSQGTLHQNFPYTFSTSAGLMGMSPARQEHVSLESTPIPYASQLAATGYRVVGREVVQSVESQNNHVLASSSSIGHAANRVNTDPTGATGVKTAGTSAVEVQNERSSAVTSRKKHSSSPSSNASTSSSGRRSPRSFIPRPPATKKSGRGRVYPGGHYRKQITARPRKAVNSSPVTAGGGQGLKSKRVLTNNNDIDQTEHGVGRRNSPSPRSGKGKSGRTQPKRSNSSESESPDHDGIIEGIKRNMEMMNMRARTTAAEEQHRRILDSLRLEFGDEKHDKSSPQAYPAHGAPYGENNGVADKIVVNHNGTTRRVHHPRVGSAGSRSGRPSAGGTTRIDSGESSYKLSGYQGERPAGSNMRVDATNGEHYQPTGFRGSRPPSGPNTRLDSSSAGYYHSVSSREGRPPVGKGVRMDFANDNYHSGFDGYSRSGRPVGTEAIAVQTVPEDGFEGIIQRPAPVLSQRQIYQEGRHDYPTSSVAHPIIGQDREQPAQARDVNLYGREASDLNRSISLEKTPTDDEINHLWAHVRSYLHSGSKKSVGSDSCVNRVDVRRSRTRSSSTQREFVQPTAPQQNTRGSQLSQPGQQFLGVSPQAGGSTLGGLRRYGSHEVLRRDSSSESLSIKRPPLLQHRASRNRRFQGQNGRPPLPRQNEHKPLPSQAGPSASVSTRGNLIQFSHNYLVPHTHDDVRTTH